VETGDPSFSILCHVENNLHGLVVVSRKAGPDGFGPLSTPAYRIVKHSPVPVLVVPGEATQPTVT
jgi:nucleotide-binding universal stress UspA family protein